ncbi:RNA helicase, partial [Nodularia sphaerocarpa CS-585A2]|nr:RNA helicase [Nodularia sphaerocarpa CS-585A2]
FGQYMATVHLRPEYDEMAQLQTQLAQLHEQIATVNEHELAVYEKLRQRLKVERQLLSTLQEQAQENRQEEFVMMLSFAVSGTLLSLKGKNIPVSIPITAVLMGKIPGNGEAPYLICLGQDNRWYVVTTKDVVNLYAELPRLDVPAHIVAPPELLLKPGQSLRGSEETFAIAQRIPEGSEGSLYMPPEVAEQLSRVTAVQAQLEANPIHQSGNVSKIFKRRARYVELEAELEQLQSQVEEHSQRHWEEFVNLISILQHFDALDNLVPTQLGRIAAAIRGENELWLGLVFASGELEHLDPHHLAAAAAALVIETPRPDSRVHFDLSNEVVEALAKLRNIRRKIFQLQRRYNVALPIWLELELIAIVEKWALGTPWTELCENTTLDEGDVVRILRRTLDLLSQIPHVPHLSKEFQRNAYRAMQLIDRFPVNEVAD